MTLTKLWGAVQVPPAGVWVWGRIAPDGRAEYLACREYRLSHGGATTVREVTRGVVPDSKAAGFLSEEAAKRVGQRRTGWMQ